MFWKTMLQHDANPRKRDGPFLILLSFPSQPLLLLLLLRLLLLLHLAAKRHAAPEQLLTCD